MATKIDAMDDRTVVSDFYSGVSMVVTRSGPLSAEFLKQMHYRAPSIETYIFQDANKWIWTHALVQNPEDFLEYETVTLIDPIRPDTLLFSWNTKSNDDTIVEISMSFLIDLPSHNQTFDINIPNATDRFVDTDDFEFAFSSARLFQFFARADMSYAVSFLMLCEYLIEKIARHRPENRLFHIVIDQGSQTPVFSCF